MRRVLSNAIVSIIVTCLMMSLVSCYAYERFETVYIENKKESENKIRLRFISSWGGVDGKAEPLQQILNQFMEDNPDIEVVNESIFGEDFLHKLKTDFASGYNPDVFGLWPGSDIRALVKAGKVAELTQVLESDKKWKESFGKSAWEYTTFDKKVYGLPLEIIYECLFINRDLFDSCNVKVPQTYKELKQAVVSFREKGITPIAYNSMAEGTYIYQNIVAKLGGKAEVEYPFKDGKVSSCYVDAMNYVKELYQMGAFPDNFFKMNSRQRDELFINKKAAMIVQGSWFLGRFDDKNNSIDIVPFPYIEEGNSGKSSLIYGLGCGAFYMSKTSSDYDKRRDASIRLLKALTSKESASLLSATTGMISNVDNGSIEFNKGRLKIKEQLLMTNAQELIGPPDSFVDRTIWEGIIVKEFPYVLAGEKTAEDVWEQAKRENTLRQ